MQATTLNALSVKRQLQTANCCAANKSYAYLSGLEEGKVLACEVEEAAIMFDLIDAIEVYTGVNTQPSYTFGIAAVSSGNTLTVQINNTFTSTVTATSSSTTQFATLVGAAVNSSFQDYTALVVGSDITLRGKYGESQNGATVGFSFSGVTLNLPLIPQELSGGIDVVNMEDNCLTAVQIESILNKLNSLCGCNCKDQVAGWRPVE